MEESLEITVFWLGIQPSSFEKYEKSVIHFTFIKTLLNYDVSNKTKELMEGGNSKSGPEQYKGT
ncbi:hypothetical protein AF332_00710 [Sporosarcina globispora]|uniref:Uncharacterized protein n=1 Tax=Sporosarcina globispora TaxID=1459 RepID=A0A0M0G7Y5_SPOGL|nr:hypothetical protein [Sporosarcina globispora]KON85536.1 hypothetical protein AF332_00710 [Sporosarcina globispora]